MLESIINRIFKKLSIDNQGNHILRGLSDESGITPSTVWSWVLRYNNIQLLDVEYNRINKEKREIQY